MSAPLGSFRHWRASVALNAATPVTVHTCPSAGTTVMVTKLTLSITTHAGSAQAVTVKDSNASPVTIAAHTDTAAAAGVLSTVNWDFGSEVNRYSDPQGGVPLTKGKDLVVVTTASGPAGILYAEGYDIKPLP